MAEQFTRNEQVVGSIPTISSIKPQCLRLLGRHRGFVFTIIYSLSNGYKSVTIMLSSRDKYLLGGRQRCLTLIVMLFGSFFASSAASVANLPFPAALFFAGPPFSFTSISQYFAEQCTSGRAVPDSV